MLKRNSGEWSLPDCQLPLYKARDKVTGDLMALKMVKMEPGEERIQELLPHTPTSTSWGTGIIPMLLPCSRLFSPTPPLR